MGSTELQKDVILLLSQKLFQLFRVIDQLHCCSVMRLPFYACFILPFLILGRQILYCYSTPYMLKPDFLFSPFQKVEVERGGFSTLHKKPQNGGTELKKF